MRIACRNLAIFALVAIAVTFALLQQYGSLLFGGVSSSEEAQSVYLIFGPLFLIIAATASALSSAGGVVGMVLAGQRGQRIWFIPLLIALVLQTYGSIVVILIPAARQTPFGGPFTREVYLWGQTTIYTIVPVIAPLVAPMYSPQLNRSARLPARTEAPDEDFDPVELEYSRLSDAPTE